MKVAIATSGSDPSAPLDPRFGRASGFLVQDLENDSFSMLDNSINLNAAQGAGIQTAQNIINSGAKAVIAAHFGPKAFQVLQAGGVAMFTSTAATVAEALEEYKTGALRSAANADVSGHWG